MSPEPLAQEADRQEIEKLAKRVNDEFERMADAVDKFLRVARENDSPVSTIAVKTKKKTEGRSIKVGYRKSSRVIGQIVEDDEPTPKPEVFGFLTNADVELAFLRLQLIDRNAKIAKQERQLEAQAGRINSLTRKKTLLGQTIQDCQLRISKLKNQTTFVVDDIESSPVFFPFDQI